MGRIMTEMEIRGRKRWTLFDSGARNSYVVAKVATNLQTEDLAEERTAALGGEKHKIKKACLVIGRVNGHWVEFNASVVSEIGKDEEGRPIEVLFGAVAMQLWGIRLDLQNEKLDLTHYSSDFVEF